VRPGRGFHMRSLVAPTPSMRFVSAHFGAQTGRCRGPCQLKASQQASQQLRHHFVAVQAFAFACPKVPGRVGPFLRSPFLSPCETRQNCRCSTDRRGTNVGFLDWGANPLLQWWLGHQFQYRKASIQKDKTQGCRERGSVSRLAQTWACVSRTTLSRWVRRTTTVEP
jgi:hypothetical protein